MALQIELTPEQEARLNAAARRSGVEPEEMLQKLVDEHLPSVSLQGDAEDPTLALFARWEQEDAQKTAEASAEEERLWEAFEHGINATRRAQGMREL